MEEQGARGIAYRILLKLEESRSNSAMLLQEALSKVADAKDRNFVTDLVLGTLRWRGKLLYWIDCFSKRPLRQIDSKVAVILQLGIYQLVFTSIAQHAAIYETVNLCKRVKLSSAASFVNGILRAVQAQLSSMPEPPETDLVRSLSVRWSHPDWVVTRWLERFGEKETVSLLEANNQPPPIFLRVNHLHVADEEVMKHLKDEDVVVKPAEFGPHVLVVVEGAPQLTRSFVEGEFYIQDAGSEILGNEMAPEKGARVLELAAAPGGKTFQIAIRMSNDGLIVAVDSDKRRVKMWRKNAERMKIRCAVPLVADARNLPLLGSFDLVVADAPCSSLGVVRRHPEIKWWRREEDLLDLQALQLQILEACAKYVGDQGKLIYSVCSFEPEETMQVCEKFLAAVPRFRMGNQVCLFPHRNQTDGFFIARFV